MQIHQLKIVWGRELCPKQLMPWSESCVPFSFTSWLSRVCCYIGSGRMVQNRRIAFCDNSVALLCIKRKMQWSHLFSQESTIPVSYLQWRIGEASADASFFLKDTADIILAGTQEEAPQRCSTSACEQPPSTHQGDIEVEWDWNQRTGCMTLIPVSKVISRFSYTSCHGKKCNKNGMVVVWGDL